MIAISHAANIYRHHSPFPNAAFQWPQSPEHGKGQRCCVRMGKAALSPPPSLLPHPSPITLLYEVLHPEQTPPPPGDLRKPTYDISLPGDPSISEAEAIGVSLHAQAIKH